MRFDDEINNAIDECANECANAFDELLADYAYQFDDDDKKYIIDRIIKKLNS